MDVRDIRRFLREAGATEEDIEHAQEQGWLPLLAIDRVLMPGRPRYDVAALAAAAGADEETARRLWRVLGFPDVPTGVDLFTDRDLAAMRLALGRLGPDTDWDIFYRQARVISSAMARVGAIEAEVIAGAIDTLRAGGLADDEVAAAMVDGLDWSSLAEIIDYVHRIQTRAALWRHLARDTFSDIGVAIGFADLAGYTELSRLLTTDELGDLLARWEELTFDTAAAHGGRIVKTIGDEVMFAGLPDAVGHIGLEIVEAAAATDGMPAVRVGLASGPVIARDGDYYGPVVNLASRLTDLAPPGTVLASAMLHEQLAGNEGFAWEPAGPHHIRGVGEEQVFTVRRAG